MYQDGIHSHRTSGSGATRIDATSISATSCGATCSGELVVAQLVAVQLVAEQVVAVQHVSQLVAGLFGEAVGTQQVAVQLELVSKEAETSGNGITG
jgi:hypothetical protein